MLERGARWLSATSLPDATKSYRLDLQLRVAHIQYILWIKEVACVKCCPSEETSVYSCSERPLWKTGGKLNVIQSEGKIQTVSTERWLLYTFVRTESGKKT